MELLEFFEHTLNEAGVPEGMPADDIALEPDSGPADAGVLPDEEGADVPGLR